MERELYGALMKWKDSADRKPLIICGVRQCGKTYLMRQFGEENYRNVAYLKFEGNETLSRIFDDDLEPKRLLRAISMRLDIDITEDSLIIFDEIQECPRAMTSLKSFCESAPQYHVICAGSLLGLQGKGSFPVGKVSFLNLYPMSFREFVRASDPRLYRYISELNVPDTVSKDRLSELFSEYLAVGGMPAAVSKWVETRNMAEVDSILDGLVTSYRLDFLKHVPEKDIKKVNMIWDSVHKQLASENRRFFFGHAVKGARSVDLEDALQWLIDAGMVYKVPRIERVGIPLSAYTSDTLFKIYMMDVGVLRHMAGVTAIQIMERNLDPLFLGGFIENFVLCELTSYGCVSQGYWASDNVAEVDFLLSSDSGPIPVEVKSSDRYRAASLKEYADRYSPTKAIVISGKDYHENGTVFTIPLYYIWVICRIIRSS